MRATAPTITALVTGMTVTTVVVTLIAGCAAGPGSDASHPGQTASPSAAAPFAHPVRAGTIVVLGDSTAAGDGLPLLPDPSAADRACGRSAQAYAAALAHASGRRVVNLACDGATVSAGLLHPQPSDGVVVRPQVASAARVRHTSAVIVSIGANDVGWADSVRECVTSPDCGGPAAAASFAGQLASFRAVFGVLLRRLARLPGHPLVVVNRYYDPFGSQPSCLGLTGFTPAAIGVLRSRLAQLNGVLARGAGRFRFPSPQPSFAGHQLCTPAPYVQWLGDGAPFHPTAAGQLAIARADLAAL